jgi:calcineurin-like phosphoesterase family protein
MGMVWFTSDTHFGHENIIKYCDRPFASREEMDQAIVERWNLVVKPSDTVYHLGDFAFTRTREFTERLLKALHGKIHLVPGGHDGKHVRTASGFERIHERLDTITVFDKTVAVCHYPLMAWDRSRYGSWMLHGHVHSKVEWGHTRIVWRRGKPILRADVGVDAWDFAPASFEQIRDVMDVK